MRTPFLWIFTLLAAAVSYSCTPEEKPGDNKDFDVKLEIPAQLTVKSNATTLEFSVLEGKGTEAERPRHS